MAESRVYHIHKLNGDNYQLWKKQMEIYMTENKLKSYILGTSVKPETDSSAWEEKDAEAQAFIMRGLELQQLKYLSDCSSAQEMWSKLKAVHAEKSDQSAQVLLEKFINCKMADEEAIADFIARVTSMTERLKDLEMEQKPAMIIAKILSSLPTKYDHVRTAWYAVPRNEQSIERLTDHLVNEEQLIKIRNEDDSSNKAAFAAYRKERDTYRAFKHQAQNQGHVNVKRNGKCNYCNKPGHWARECLKRQRNQSSYEKNTDVNQNIKNSHKYKGHSLSLQSIQEQITHIQQQQQLSKNANYETADDKSHLFVLQSTCYNQKINDLWYADSGATDHMTFQKEFFKSLKPFPHNSCFVKVGDGRKLIALGVGDIEVRVAKEIQMAKDKHTDSVHVIKNVLLVPDLDRNFISVMCAAEKGMNVVFKEGGEQVVFMKNNKVIVDGVRENKLYKMNIVAIKTAELNVSTSFKTWHERLGHVNFQTLKDMFAKRIVNDLTISDKDENLFCEGCVYGKQHRTSFPKDAAIRSNKPGEVFHVDLCGKMSTPSLGGANYFMLFKDDFSRYSYVYFLNKKTNVLDKLAEFIADVSSVGHSIKSIRSDCGLEFCNESVKRFLLANKIKHQTATPRAPEQNGFIERHNRTIIESAKAMLHARELPLYLWAEATNTAVYLKNRTSSNVINGVTPYQMWFGRKPSVGNLRIFGCRTFVHIPKEQRTKWEKNSFECLLLGYNDDSKAYRVFDPKNKKILIRRDVKFCEEEQRIHEIVLTKEIEKEDAKENPNINDDDIKEKQKYEGNSETKFTKNPRAPIDRDPYPIRSKINVDEEPHLCFLDFEPTNLEDALKCENAEKWLDAINEEINALNKNKTWILVPRPKDKNVITNRWVFKKKLKSDGTIDKYKARLVAKGFLQKKDLDYTEVFSPVVRYDSVRMILAIAAAYDLHIIQFDVKTAFLHGSIDDEIFMEQPYGFKVDDKVCLLKKGLYGLKQASRQWNKRIVEFLKSKNFKQSMTDTCVFLLNEQGNIVYLALYVDDGLICGNNMNIIDLLLNDLHKEFEVTTKEAEFFVGMQIEKTNSKIKIFQSFYVNKILQKFNHLQCYPVDFPAEPGIKFAKQIEPNNAIGCPYREAIGSLLYLVVCSRPDIAYIVGVLSRYVENPSHTHWEGVKRIFKYLKGTMTMGINFQRKTNKINLNAYSDADWGGDSDTRRSTTGYICFLNNGPITWSSKRQTITATSTTEAEFIALCAVTKSVVCLRKVLRDLGHEQMNPTIIQCDNQRAITLVKNPESSNRTKHVDIQYFYTCDIVKQKEVDVIFVQSRDQLADYLTKPLPKDKFKNMIFRSNLSCK